MNKFGTTLTALITLSCAPAFAVSTTDLTITGLITPSACTPSLSSGGLIEIGKVSSGDLNPNPAHPTFLDKRTLQMSVNCDAATLVAFKAIDNRKGSAYAPDYYGLGFINGTQQLGMFGMKLSNPVADTGAAQMIFSEDAGTTWSAGDKWWLNFYYMSVGSQADGSQPMAFKDLTMDLFVQTNINATKNLDLTNEAPIDGSATLEVMYL